MSVVNASFKTTNYMVPSSGQTHGVQYKGNFGANFFIDWRQFTIDNELFQPQGVFIDNTLGTVPLTILVWPINYTITCPIGQTLQAQFPAPNGQTCYVSGDGANTAYVTFVDFPVLPSQTQTAVIGTVNTTITGSPTVTVLPFSAGTAGVPYRTQEYVGPASLALANINAGGTTANAVPAAANLNLRYIRVTLSGDAAQAVAGDRVVTISLNGVTVWQDTFYIPAAATAGVASYLLCAMPFDFAAFNAGAGPGNFNVTIDAALTAGKITAQGWFAVQ